MDDVVGYVFECYLHQDCQDDYGASMEALEDFVRCEDNKTIVALLNEFIELRYQADPEKLEVRLQGVNLDPEAEGLSLNTWLDKAVNILQRAQGNG